MAKKLGRRYERAAIQLVREIEIGAHQKLFNHIEKQDEKIAAFLKPAFDEFMRVNQEISESDPDGETSIADLEKRIPENLWLETTRKIFSGGKLTPISPESRESFRREVRKRLKKTDLH